MREEIGSVWETAILKLIHPEDLTDKYLQELHFFHFVKHLSASRRSDYCLVQRLRMKDRFGNYQQALHRLFYIPSPFDDSLWLTLCLYNPLFVSLPYSGLRPYGRPDVCGNWRSAKSASPVGTRTRGAPADRQRPDEQGDR